MSSSFHHLPVMLPQVLEALRPRAGGAYADGTVGGGGHSEAILDASAPDGYLFGCDQDEQALEAAANRLARFRGRFELKQMNFRGMETWLGPNRCDGILLDLGVSSPQLDRGERGFSFQHEGPLDMRMDRRQKRTAADVINTEPAEELARVFWEYGDERNSRRFARAIDESRRITPIRTTSQLANLIEREEPRRGRKTHPATKVFQALRIAVNDEIGALREGLTAAWNVLRPGARLAVITFHSLEDRVVKEFGRTLEKDYEVVGEVDRPEFRKPREPFLRWLPRKAILPTDEEQKQNPRSRSAQLRVMEKLR
jgi:16S rRNA (cytosine1402-N4)-methyltransferase